MKHFGNFRFGNPGFRLLPVFLLAFVPMMVFSQESPRGDSAMADLYAEWAGNIIEQGYWSEGLAALERANDFANVSSDISFLLALARSHENKPRESVIEAFNMALAVNRWVMYYPVSARLMKAENLIALRAYNEALVELSHVDRGPREASLTLMALAPWRPVEFRRLLRETLDRYPRESEPVRLFFKFIANNDADGMIPSSDDLEILELIRRRLPALVLDDPELAWIAAPYIRDIDEARRMVSAYRAVNDPVQESIPIALKLGVIDEETALAELFDFSRERHSGGNILEIALLGEIWDLLGGEEPKALFRRNLSAYTGVITEDADRDGFPETFAEYDRGWLRRCVYDTAQDRVPALTIFFEGGNPHRALALIPPEPVGGGSRPTTREWSETAEGFVESALTSRKSAEIQWERYPAVLETELDGARFIPRPFDFHFSPVLFVELWGSGAFFPRRDPMTAALTRRTLVSWSLRVERPSLEFNGGIEVVELNQGIPVRAREYVGGLMVAETEFLRGRPQIQWVDLDFNGRMDTVRHFSRAYRAMELEELWNYDRIFDYTVNNPEVWQ
jgi:hypothetical protein